MKRTVVLLPLILLLALILFWQLAELRTSNSYLSSSPSRTEKTVAREPAQMISQENKVREEWAYDRNKQQEDRTSGGADVFGIVRNQAGSPVSGAEVKAFQGNDYHQGGEIVTATLGDGSYSLSGLHSSTGIPYKVVASAEGYAPASSEPFFISHSPRRIDLTLTKGASLSGRVMDESRRAIPGATVELLQGAWNSPKSSIERMETDADGAYIFKQPPPGNYWVFVSATRFINQNRNITISSKKRRMTQDFFLEYAGAGNISGMVLDEKNQPVEGVNIEASQTYVGELLTGRVFHTCNSSADGSFLLEGFVTKGNDGGKVPIKVKATKKGYEASEVSVFSGDQRVLIRLRLSAQRGSISGRVVEAVEGDSLIPITEFQIEVITWENSLFAIRSFQSDTGEFLFTDIDEGLYDLFISAPSRAPHLQQRLLVKSGEDTSVGAIRLARGATITGEVRGKRNREPLSEAMVYIKAGRLAGEYLRILAGTSTDGSGSYRLEGVPPGPNYVLASHPDYATAISPKVQVVEGREYSNVDLLLGNGGSIEGKVTDDGIPLTGLIITMFPLRESVGALGPYISIQADEMGYYRKDKLMPSSYHCSATIPGRRADVTGQVNVVTDMVEISEDKTTTFDIDLCEGGGSVTGKVTAEAPIPPEAIGISISLSGGNNNYYINTSVGSSYSFDSVCPGEYDIRTSFFYIIPGGTRTRTIPCRLNPAGVVVVEPAKKIERDVILLKE